MSKMILGILAVFLCITMVGCSEQRTNKPEKPSQTVSMSKEGGTETEKNIQQNTESADNKRMVNMNAPKVYVLKDHWPGDHENPLRGIKRMKPKKETKLYAEKSRGSKQVATIKADEFVVLVTADYHGFPAKSKVEVIAKEIYFSSKSRGSLQPGEAVYLLGYVGEGLYMAWYNNEIIHVSSAGISGLEDIGAQPGQKLWGKLVGVAPKAELWVRLKAPDGTEGWCLFNYDDWQINKFNIFF